MTSKQLKRKSIGDPSICSKCETSKLVETHNYCHPGVYEEGEILCFRCLSCRELPQWSFCNTCGIKLKPKSLHCHHRSSRHQIAHHALYDAKKQKDPVAPSLAEKVVNEVVNETMASFDIPMDSDMDSVASDTFLEKMEETMKAKAEEDLRASYDHNGYNAMDDIGTATNTGTNKFLPIDMKGNEWLAKVMKDTPRATLEEMFSIFNRWQETVRMKNFWVAERASGDGKCGGGIMFLVGKAFQRVKDQQFDDTKIPDWEEAKWHLENMIQYQTTNDKQRSRQARLMESLATHLQPGSFFRQTSLPLHCEMGRYYGTGSRHSMLLNMPYPEAQVVGGVAYIGPKAIIAFMMANGVPIDNIVIRAPGSSGTTETEASFNKKKLVHNVPDSRKAFCWRQTVQEQYYRQDSTSEKKKVQAIIGLAISDWKDGFGSGKCKSNRNSVDVKSITIGAPREHINATNNTFPVAVGLKHAEEGWLMVDKLYQKEIKELTDPSNPLPFYHGVLQKIVYVSCHRFAVITDKAERPIATGTLGHGGATHRCFGTAGTIQTPSCKLGEIKANIKKQQLGTAKGTWGWSEKFISSDGNPNGAILPACISCRRNNLQKIGIVFPGQDKNPSNGTPCGRCTNWVLLPRERHGASLDFPRHKDYPKKFTEGSPIDAPEGRNVFNPAITTIPFADMSWCWMIQACKFAFFQATRPKGCWTKTATVCYLKSCGINPDLANELFAVAHECRKDKTQDTIDYFAKEGIGKFEWPPAWLSDQISLKGHIEAIMHITGLGIEESNFELIARWLADTPAAAKVGETPFLKNLQELLKDLRPFMLSWLAIFPLTGKKGKLGTGSWVAENQLSFIRISLIAYGWCTRHHEITSKYGVDDMSRMVIAWHALIARLMTHGGVDDEFIEETSLYVKEFLSTVREFDVRVRHADLNKPTSHVSGLKATEAWWLKSNYMSLGNLLSMMWLLGPLVLWWDGGGKGERFIQLVKPHLKRGVREDAMNFFKRLIEKLFQLRQMDLFELRYDLEKLLKEEATEEAIVEISELIIEIADCLLPDSSTLNKQKQAGDSSASSEEEEEVEVTPREACFSTSQVHGMTKQRTIYTYRTAEKMKTAVRANKPIAGVVEVVKLVGKTAFEFKTVCRKPKREFGRYNVHFNDSNGVMFHGMWYAPIEVEEECHQSTKDFSEIQAAAKLSAVAIPLWYVVGKEHPDASKYCVITNWWKNRMSTGHYMLPSLDATLYGGEGREENGGEEGEGEGSKEHIKFPTKEVSMQNGVAEDAEQFGVI